MIGTKAFFVHNQRFGEKKLILIVNPHDNSKAYPLTKFRSDRLDKEGHTISYYGCYECRLLNNRKTRYELCRCRKVMFYIEYGSKVYQIEN